MKNILLKNCNIIDGTKNSNILENYDILIKDEKIIKIEKNIIDNNCQILNLNGSYVIPGLINLHSHLPSSGKLSKSKVANKQNLIKNLEKTKLGKYIILRVCLKNAQNALYSGTTTIRTVGGISYFDGKLRDLINSNKYEGPRIITSDYAIGPKNGHMDGTVAKAALTNDEAINIVKEHKENNSDLIKIMVTGGILDTTQKGVIGLLKMNPDMVKVICEEAHKYNYKVAAHVEGKEGMEAAILNGVDAIEHGAMVDDNLLDKFKDRNGIYVQTLSAAIPLKMIDPKLFGYDEVATFNSNYLFNQMIELSSSCLNKNIIVGLGTDSGCPMITHYDMWRELFYFSKFVNGVDNNFAIYSATLNNAKILGIDKETGSIEINKYADLLIVKENPLNDLRALKNPQYVFFKGKLINKKPKKMKKVDKLLDEVMMKF